LTVEGNRDKFLTANIGGDGSEPFGIPPAVFLYGPVANIATNYGASGSFTANGSLENE
jgi:hypothetical protein